MADPSQAETGKRTLPAFLLIAAVLLSGCSTETSPKSDSAAAGSQPTVGASLARSDRDLAARYRSAGGYRDVYGLKYVKSRAGVPTLTVWTRKKSGYGSGFDEFDKTLTSFLTGTGVNLQQGYVLTVHGPDGAILHRYDTTSENNP
ncbi:hypothetical protein [Streptomyces sp. NBC_00328]|uniref:hypothetical protein n=1 Tax=Streptomyces sp. NBC_00328 TaxID=2903646 RepID=UPI002E2A5A87|nr:hypothetical protein [Streptomyces sp. NBC_00328]